MKVTLDNNKLNVTVKEQNLTLKSPAGLVPHAITHKSGGSDEIKLDELGVPSDTTALDATIERHGLLPKLPNDANKFLNGLGNWSVIQIPELNWANIVNKPSNYPPEPHTHEQTEVINLLSSLDELKRQAFFYGV